MLRPKVVAGVLRKSSGEMNDEVSFHATCSTPLFAIIQSYPLLVKLLRLKT